jgi:hypothetical protein
MSNGRSDPPENDDEPRGVRLWLEPFFRDSTLWPVLIAAAAVFVVIGAWAMLTAWVDRNPFSLAALLGMAWGSADALIRDWRDGRSRLLLVSVLGFWVLSVAAAVGARWTGWY